MKSREERARGPEGELPNWLRDQRKMPRPGFPNGWKEAEAIRRLEAAVPGVSFGAYRDIEAGNRRVSEDQRKAIALVYGAIPDFTSEGSASGPHSADLSALTTALTAQAESFARMLAFALDRDRSVEARIRALEAEVQSLRGRLGVEASQAQSTPPQIEG